jgi:hypothetical protein
VPTSQPGEAVDFDGANFLFQFVQIGRFVERLHVDDHLRAARLLDLALIWRGEGSERREREEERERRKMREDARLGGKSKGKTAIGKRDQRKPQGKKNERKNKA